MCCYMLIKKREWLKLLNQPSDQEPWANIYTCFLLLEIAIFPPAKDIFPIFSRKLTFICCSNSLHYNSEFQWIDNSNHYTSNEAAQGVHQPPQDNWTLAELWSLLQCQIHLFGTDKEINIYTHTKIKLKTKQFRVIQKIKTPILFINPLTWICRMHCTHCRLHVAWSQTAVLSLKNM